VPFVAWGRDFEFGERIAGRSEKAVPGCPSLQPSPGHCGSGAE